MPDTTGCRHDGAAVLARSIVSAADSVLVTGAGPGGTILDGGPLLLALGRVGLRVPGGTPLAGARQATRAGKVADVAVHVTGLVPVPVRRRVRARIMLSGGLLPWDGLTLSGSDACQVGPVLDGGEEVWVLEVRHVLVDTADELVSVTPTAWAAAAPDPLSGIEAVHLEHLCSRHREGLRCLAALLDPAVTVGVRRVVPVALDSWGLVLRAEGRDRDVDVRLPFARPVVTPDALRREMAVLLASAVQRRRPRTRTG